MHVRCPHCNNPIEVVKDDPLKEIACLSCGSSFNLVTESLTTVSRPIKLATIGHFELISPVGQGAFGTVWRAKDTQLDRTVAIKIPREGQVIAEDSEQFLREARAAAQLKHRNIVSVYEVGRHDGRVYIVSEFILGVTLADRLTAGPLSVREAVELCAQVADPLHHAHEQGVTHRDLKPSNIMLDGAGHPHIMDFGLAKRDAGEITMTLEGKVLGTPAYMPPEQAKGEGHQADARSDLYSLGVILFELLTGELPFRGNQQMLLHQVIHDEPPSPRKLNQSVPRDLETICLKCLQKEPSRRYQTTAELATDLRHWLDGEPITARPVTWMERSWRWCKRKPAVAGLATVSVAALLAIVALIVGNTYQQQLETTNTALLDANQESEKQRLIAERKGKIAEQASQRAKVFEEEAIASREEVLEFFEQAGKGGLQTPQVVDFLLAEEVNGDGSNDPFKIHLFADALKSGPELANAVSKILMQKIFAPRILSESTDLHIERLLLEQTDIFDAEELASVYRQRSGMNPDNQQYKVDLANTLFSLQMDIYGCYDEFDEEDLLEAHDIFENLSKQNPGEPTFKISLGDVHQFMGLISSFEYSELDAEASGYCQRAIDIFTGLASEYPDEPLYRMRLARAYNSFGCAAYHDYSHEKLAIAPGYIDRAIAIYTRLVEDHPEVPLYQQGLALAYSNLGCIRGAIDEIDLAVNSYRKAISIYEQLCVDERTFLASRSNPSDQTRMLMQSLRDQEPMFGDNTVSSPISSPIFYETKLRQIYNLSSTYQGLLEHLSFADQPDQVTEIYIRLYGIGTLLRFDEFKSIPGGAKGDVGNYITDLLDDVSPFLDRLATKNHPYILSYFPIPDTDMYVSWEFHDGYMNLLNKNLNKWHQQVIKTGESLIRSNPHQISYLVGLAFVLRDIGNMRQENGQLAEAATIYQKVVQILEPLQPFLEKPDRQLDPSVTARLAGFGFTVNYRVLIDLYRKTGQLEQAAATTQKLIQLMSIFSHSVYPEMADPTTYLLLADVQEEMGQLDEAIESRRSFVLHLEWLDKIIAPDQINTESILWGGYRRRYYDFARLFSLTSPPVTNNNDLQNTERTKLADERTGRAMELLHLARGQGFFKDPKNLANMKKDSDLDPLRDRDDFKQLVKELEEDLQK